MAEWKPQDMWISDGEVLFTGSEKVAALKFIHHHNYPTLDCNNKLL
jgi:hypothetical protein